MENYFSAISQLTKRLSISKFAVALIFVLSGFAAMAQQGELKGIVTDESDAPLPGVTVMVKGTSNGTITNFDGEYTLKDVKEGDVIVLSFIGMLTQEIAYSGQASLNVNMETDTQNLDEVVVTALGIQRNKKTLTYSSQQVTGDEMLKARDINFMNSLSGKTAGLEVRKSSSGAGGSTRTVLRGSKSVNLSSEPLYVIDGIPLVNRKGGQAGMWGGTDEGDGLSQINPDDIESISILKGSNAAVLYGSEGANGVIIINTKSGKAGKTKVTINTSTVFESIIETPDLQFSYGSEGGAKESWSYTKGNYDSNYVDDFFQTGFNAINTVTVSGGGEKTTAYFSYGNTSANGVLPNNEYHKNNVTFKQSTKLLNDKLKISSNVMLTSEKSKNRYSAGYYLNPLTGLYFFPRDRDFNSYKENYEVFNEDRNMYLQNWFVADHHQSNPYWLLNKQPKEDITKRIIASATIEYEISKHLKFQARGSYDYAQKSFEQKFYAGGNATNISENGRWSYKKYNDQLIYADGMFTYDNTFGDFSLNTVLGAIYQKSIYNDGVSVDNGTNSLLYANEFYFQNIPSNVQIQSIYGGKIIKNGVFGTATIGYKDMIYLDFSGRNDWASTLYLTGNESYFYPSLGVSGILSEMFELPEFINFSKVRISNSTINNEVPFNLIRISNTISSSGGIDRNTRAPFITAKPEKLETWELGTDWRFFDGRLGLDFTYYNIVSTNQALQRDANVGQQADGYTEEYFNAGKIVNKGVEIVLSAVPVKSSDFNWATTINFSKNNNKIEVLYPGDTSKFKDFGTSEGYTARGFSGGSIGAIYGYKFLRNENGQIILDEESGKPLKTPSEISYENREEAYLGNLEPDFSLGWSNNFDYKQLSLSFLINAKIGGKSFSQTESMLDGYGVSQRTADARDNGGVEINAIKGSTPVTSIDPKDYYTTIGGRNGITEAYVYDRTNIRLTQLALTYDFDVANLNLPIQGASLSLVGQNLFFIYKKAPFDPELTMSTGIGSQSLDNFNVPATRTYGFNLKINF